MKAAALSRLVAAAALALSAGAHAEVFDLSFSDDAFRVGLTGPLSQLSAQTSGQYDLGVIVEPDREGDPYVAHLGVMATGDAGMRDFTLTAGLGLRGVYIGSDDEDGGAVAVGGQVEARFPGYDRIGVSLYGHYAPEVLSFDFDQYYEVGAAVAYQLLRNASVYAGWRNVNVELEDDGGDVTVHSGFHGGLRLSFF